MGLGQNDNCQGWVTYLSGTCMAHTYIPTGYYTSCIHQVDHTLGYNEIQEHKILPSICMASLTNVTDAV